MNAPKKITKAELANYLKKKVSITLSPAIPYYFEQVIRPKSPNATLSSWINVVLLNKLEHDKFLI